MHIPFYILVPYSIKWLLLVDSIASDGNALFSSNNNDAIHYAFIVYTTILTTVSLFLDTITLFKWMLGYELGVYPVREEFMNNNEMKESNKKK